MATVWAWKDSVDQVLPFHTCFVLWSNYNVFLSPHPVTSVIAYITIKLCAQRGRRLHRGMVLTPEHITRCCYTSFLEHGFVIATTLTRLLFSIRSAGHTCWWKRKRYGSALTSAMSGTAVLTSSSFGILVFPSEFSISGE